MTHSERQTYCRSCSGYCGIHVHLEHNKISKIVGVKTNPISVGHLCGAGKLAAQFPHHSRRLTQPLKREGDRFVPCSWEIAFQEIGDQLQKIITQHGPQSLGLYGGTGLAHNTLGSLQTLGFVLGTGTRNFFTPLARNGAPQLYATEKMFGAPFPLQSDVGRSHYTILLGADQESTRWGRFQSGTVHGNALKHFRKTRKSKLIAVDPRSTPLSSTANQHIQIRPATELWFLLGMAHAILKGGWCDEQYLDLHCINRDELLSPWTPKRVAPICGVEANVISGIALKFSRAAMATISLGANVLQQKNGTLTAWAWLMLHAITANLLRPGGLYEVQAAVDINPFLSSIKTDDAPQSRVKNFNALCMQMPDTTLCDEILTPGKDQIKALICVQSDPHDELPNQARVSEALDQLDLLVAIGTLDNSTVRLADWVLPATTFWEREDMLFLSSPTLPIRFHQGTKAVIPPVAESKPEHEILSEMFKHLKISHASSAWGLHLHLLGRKLSKDGVKPWLNRGLQFFGLPDFDALTETPQGIDEGDIDRASWRIETNQERIDLAPTVFREAIQSLQYTPPSPEWDLTLMITEPVENSILNSPPIEGHTPKVHISSARGIKEGANLQVDTPHGSIIATAQLREGLRKEVIVLPWAQGSAIGNLLDENSLDPFTGAPELLGIPCRISVNS